MATVKTFDRPRGLTTGQWFRDIDRHPAVVKHRDDVVVATIDWANDMAAGESISTVTYDANGVTVSGEAVDNTTSSANVTGIGELEVKMTTDLGRVIVQTLRFYAANGRRSINDYRG